MLTENTVRPSAPIACVVPWPSTMPSASQSFAPPSANAMPSMITPSAYVRGSRHADSDVWSRSRQWRFSAASTGSIVICRAGTIAWVTNAMTAITTAMTDVCTRTLRPTATASAPRPAPITVPKLKNAWNSGRIVLPTCFSIAAPSTFIITSTAPLPSPNSTRPPTTNA